jgi:hypothetical protein
MRNALIVLEALQMGMEVEIGGITYVWLENHVLFEIDGVPYGINGLASKHWVELPDGTRKTEYMGRDMSLNAFVAMCNEISEDYIGALVMNIAFNQMRREKYGR